MCSDQVQSEKYLNLVYNFFNNYAIVDQNEITSSELSTSSKKQFCLGQSSNSASNNNNSYQSDYNWVQNICKQTLDPKKRHLILSS